MLVQIYVLVDSDGEYVVSTDLVSVAELYEDTVGGDATCARRVLHFEVEVPTPSVEEIRWTVSDLPPTKIEEVQS